VKKLSSPAEMQAGKVYNLIDIGPNKAYARINGKRTILILETTPKLKYVQLYDAHCIVASDHLRGHPCTIDDLARAFEEDEIFEPASQDEWFKHSAKVRTLADGIAQGLLTREQIQKEPVRSRLTLIDASGAGGKRLGIYTFFSVEDQTNQPLLQYVYVWWDSEEEMRKDFEEYGVTIVRT
jgi:hypothetical protein